MATRYHFGDSHVPHFVTFATVQWVNALSRKQYKDIVVDSLMHCINEKQLRLHAWVIMDNHVHLIISSLENKLEHIVRDMKKHTSKKIVAAIENNDRESRKDWMLWLFASAGKANSNNDKYQFWQQDNHPVMLVNKEMFDQKAIYIHENPVRAGIVFEPWQYVYSSGVNYYKNETGLLPIELFIYGLPDTVLLFICPIQVADLNQWG